MRSRIGKKKKKEKLSDWKENGNFGEEFQLLALFNKGKQWLKGNLTIYNLF